MAGIESKEKLEEGKGRGDWGPVHDHVKGAFGKFLAEE